MAFIHEEWSGFRTKYLWTQTMNDLFKANLLNITQLMKNYFKPRAQYLDINDAIAIFSKHTDVLTEKEAYHCYGMSKMTNPIETKEYKKHLIMQQCELIEMITRAADAKFKGTPSMDLKDKVITVMNKLFAIIKSKVVIPPDEEDENLSESDEDY